MGADDVAHLRKPPDARVVEEAGSPEEVDSDEEVSRPTQGAEGFTDLFGARTTVVEGEQHRPSPTSPLRGLKSQNASGTSSGCCNCIQVSAEQVWIEFVPSWALPREPARVGRPRLDVVIHQ
jgi:hypothetical protein